MNRAALKTGALAAPLAALVLGLNAWGDPAGRWIHRQELSWTYPERIHGDVVVRLPRNHEADEFAAREVAKVRGRILALHGPTFRLRPPAAPFRVHLLEEDRFAAFGFKSLEARTGACDPALGIAVQIGPVINQGDATRELQHQTVHAILQASGLKGWSPWLEEGVAALLEEAPVAPDPDLPSLMDLLQARPEDFRGGLGARYARGAALLTLFLYRTMREAFFHYYWEEQEGGPGDPARFAEVVDDLPRVEVLWKEWLKDPATRHK